MTLKRILSILVVLGICLLSVPAMATPKEGIGAPPDEVLRARSPMSKEKDMEQIQAKEKHEKKLISERLKKEKPGDITIQACPEGPCTPPSYYYLSTVIVPQDPVLNDSRVCVHCGVASTIIALRYFASRGRLTINDIPATDPEALKKLGDGWLNGANSSYAMMMQTSGGIWYADQWRMRSNLNARQTYASYIISNRNSYTSASSLSSSLKYTIWAEKPAVFLVDTAQFAFYKGRSLGHFVAMDAYSSSGTSHRINDPNNCAKVPDANGNRTINVVGYHWVTETETYNALYATESLLW